MTATGIHDEFQRSYPGHSPAGDSWEWPKRSKLTTAHFFLGLNCGLSVALAVTWLAIVCGFFVEHRREKKNSGYGATGQTKDRWDRTMVETEELKEFKKKWPLYARVRTDETRSSTRPSSAKPHLSLGHVTEVGYESGSGRLRVWVAWDGYGRSVVCGPEALQLVGNPTKEFVRKIERLPLDAVFPRRSKGRFSSYGVPDSFALSIPSPPISPHSPISPDSLPPVSSSSSSSSLSASVASSPQLSPVMSSLEVKNRQR